VIVMLLEQIGYANVRVVHREQGGNLALLGTYDQGSAAVTSAIVARRAWKTIGRDTVRALREGLAQFGASRGVVMTVGTFGPDARDEAARTDRPTLVLVDGAGLARLLYDQGIGLATVRPVIRSVDGAFFESLE
jgi:restriction system protein